MQLITIIPKQRETSTESTVPTEGESVVPLPGCPARRPGLVVQVSFSTESPVLLAGGCKSSELPVLVDWIADPVNSWVIAHSIMGNIHQNHLIVLVSRILFSNSITIRTVEQKENDMQGFSILCTQFHIHLLLQASDYQMKIRGREYNLVDPVRIENPQTTQLSPCSFFCNGSLAALELQLGNTLVGWLSIHNTLGNWPLPTTTSHTDSVYHITLQTISLVTIKGSCKQFR